MRPLAALILIYLLGAALAAVQLLPAIEALALSRRGLGVSLEEFLALPASPDVLLGLLVPRMAASPTYPYFVLGGVFVGTLAVVLAIEGARSTRRENLFLTAALVVTFLLALGPFTPIGSLAYEIPGLNAFRYPFKHLLEVVFCLAALALLGRRRAAVASALIVVWLGLAGNRDAIFALAERTSPEPPRILEALARRKETILGPRYASVVLSRDKRIDGHALLWLDYPTEFQIPSVHGSSPFAWSAYRKALIMSENGIFGLPDIVFGGAHQALNVLGVRFLGTAGLPLAGKVIHQDPRAIVLERSTALPAPRFVDGALCMEPYNVSRQLRRPEYDFSAVALLDCEGRPALPRLEAASLRSRVALLEAAPGYLRMRVRLQRGAPGVLIVSQSDIPGWRARIDGAPVPIYRAYGLVQGLVVPAGLHEVELEYLPGAVIAGGVISLAALVTVVALGALGVRSRRRRIAG